MNNEEKILQTLEQHGKLLEQQKKALETQGKTLEQHGKLLETQGKTLEQHGKLLETQGKTLEQQGKTLEQQGKLLEALMSQQAEMHDLLQKVAVTQEAVVLPRLDLLAEGHTHLVDTLAGKSRVENLEDDVDFLKSVVKALSQEIKELKKAQ